jgi:ribose transport system substrate-binding protein
MQRTPRSLRARGLAVAGAGMLLLSLSPAMALAQEASEAPAATEAAAASEAPMEAPENPYAATGAEPGSGEGLTIGYMSLGEYIPFVNLVTNGIIEQAEIAGVNLVWCDTNTNPEETFSCAQQMATQGAQGVINFQVDQQISPDICNTYNSVPTIAIDIRQPPCETIFYGANNSEAGRLAGSALGEFALNEWNCEYDAYVSLESVGAVEANTLRMGGFRTGFQEHCPLINETILADADRTDKALEDVSDLLPSLPGERILVVAINEDGILGAIGAAATQGRESDLYYAGQGADPSIWPTIACDPQYIATVAYFPERYGRTVIPAMIDILNGVEVQGPLFTEHEVITSENIRDIYPDIAPCA